MLTVGAQMGYGTCFGVILDSMHTTTFSHVPLSTLSLVAGLSNFVRRPAPAFLLLLVGRRVEADGARVALLQVTGSGSLVGGRLGDR